MLKSLKWREKSVAESVGLLERILAVAFAAFQIPVTCLAMLLDSFAPDIAESACQLSAYPK